MHSQRAKNATVKNARIVAIVSLNVLFYRNASCNINNSCEKIRRQCILLMSCFDRAVTFANLSQDVSRDEIRSYNPRLSMDPTILHAPRGWRDIAVLQGHRTRISAGMSAWLKRPLVKPIPV